jgi:hypothetical protein
MSREATQMYIEGFAFIETPHQAALLWLHNPFMTKRWLRLFVFNDQKKFPNRVFLPESSTIAACGYTELSINTNCGGKSGFLQSTAPPS